MPDDTEQARASVVARYSQLAREAAAGGRVTDEEGGFGAAAYGEVAGVPEAALRASPGCGNRVAVATLEQGETVLDLGSGIEDIPLPDAQVDVVTSNCVINLSTGKPRVLAEAFRVLRPGGRLAVSDVVSDEDASPALRAEAERSIGCASGTVTAAQYRDQLLVAGFTCIRITPATDAGCGLYSAIIQAVRPAAPDGVLIRPMRARDARGVMAVYQAGLDTGLASFETAAPSWDEFDAVKLPLHRHVAASAATGQVLGWTAAWPVSVRRAYAGVIEHSIYVDPGHHGRGIGGALLAALIASSEDAGIWTVQSGVFPENRASLALHERAGFRVVGVRERVGCHHGRWRDVVAIERRSRVTGTD